MSGNACLRVLTSGSELLQCEGRSAVVHLAPGGQDVRHVLECSPVVESCCRCEGRSIVVQSAPGGSRVSGSTCLRVLTSGGELLQARGQDGRGVLGAWREQELLQARGQVGRGALGAWQEQCRAARACECSPVVGDGELLQARGQDGRGVLGAWREQELLQARGQVGRGALGAWREQDVRQRVLTSAHQWWRAAAVARAGRPWCTWRLAGAGCPTTRAYECSPVVESCCSREGRSAVVHLAPGRSRMSGNACLRVLTSGGELLQSRGQVGRGALGAWREQDVRQRVVDISIWYIHSISTITGHEMKPIKIWRLERKYRFLKKKSKKKSEQAKNV
ncbi:hypothetical protein MSG28_000648 [Choristoneura fumiferana]|uniref:Uncharacterized protein n=1 Tax=Choristoneura fumiferana TaxID=7141 RepID=A0ACC0K280_CHOFU|nr:hypothetical protein MSG28_000648 [Choristoneura fumiferana]